MVRKETKSPSSSNALNFRPPIEIRKNEKKGNKPLPDPTSVRQVLLLMIVHVCRKVLFVDPNIKVGIYILLVFFGSILGDVLPIPPSYFSRKDNLFNIYFVKLSWGWTMMSVGAFVYMTSSVYSCGDRSRIQRHMLRLLIATSMWFIWTKLFVTIEESYGYCSKAITRSGRKQCLSKGHTWSSFSISGHAFILIYCTLIIMEEAKALVCWEAIKDHLRNEEHNRNNDNSRSSTPLESLSVEQLSYLRETYEKFTPYIRMVFILMTGLALMWDVMLMATIIYFHSTPEKFVAGVISVLLWFLSYRFIFSRKLIGVPLPGEGIFRYMNPTQPLQTLNQRRSSLLTKGERTNSFMGMPLSSAKIVQSLTEEPSFNRSSSLISEDRTTR
uniref:EOG090X07YX n=1 Tax=Scapholeberis mucronata TaxID=202097 RepID=A0A4Y7NKC8_9CRUS|nr:EOG090X07YX [Scapholeberis mucronata]SVE93681.1 EOG090X07YX [Scapholeberis mucronata]